MSQPSTTMVGSEVKTDKNMTIRNRNFPSTFTNINLANPSEGMIKMSYLTFCTRQKELYLPQKSLNLIDLIKWMMSRSGSRAMKANGSE